MPPKDKNKPRIRFRTVIDVEGDNAVTIRDGLNAKMKKENRTTYNNTIETILLEHFKNQGDNLERSVATKSNR